MTDRRIGTRSMRVPEGDSLPRSVCDDCGHVAYVNPKIVVGAVVTFEDKFLMCKRAIEPRRGFWTLPAGFMETGESTQDGAKREAWEEACATIEIDGLLAVYDLPHISQVQLMYRARLVSPDIGPGPESEAVALYAWDEIPWDELAFPSVKWALDYHRAVGDAVAWVPQSNPERARAPI